MTKFGQAEYNDFMARIFADKLDKLLKESEKQNYICVIKRRSVGGIEMLGFVIGIFIGEIIGVFTMCLCRATSEADKCMDSTDSEE